MLSEKRVSRPVSKFDRPLLPEPMTYRVVFSKVGNLQFFSHLDLQRTWQRVLVRASIPMWYTQGFRCRSAPRERTRWWICALTEPSRPTKCATS